MVKGEHICTDGRSVPLKAMNPIVDLKPTEGDEPKNLIFFSILVIFTFRMFGDLSFEFGRVSLLLLDNWI